MKIILIIVLIAIILLGIIFGMMNNSYAIFVENEDGNEKIDGGGCVVSYKSCRCFGFLKTSPNKLGYYTCFGFNYCGDIKAERC